MSAVGWVGLGKLGLTCALVLEKHGGHKITGHDPSPRPADILAGRVAPPHEEGIQELIDGSHLEITPTPAGVVRATDGVIFVAVQTPHAPEYGGEVPAPHAARDFEYGYLVQAVRDLATAARDQSKFITVVIVSTCLPGTVNRLVRPVINEMVKIIYNPAFIAMGTTVEDFLHPEFVLLGADCHDDVRQVAEIYDSLHARPLQIMSIESAELTKIAYNVFI